jgi:hypothetical protein
MEKIKMLDHLKSISQRSALVLFLMTAPIFTTGCGNESRRDSIRQREEALFEPKKELENIYHQNPEVILQKEFFNKIQNIYIYEEFLGYCEREKKKDTGLEETIESLRKNFFQEIIDENKEIKIETIKDIIKLAINLKTSFQEGLGRDDTYEKNHANFVDPAFEKAFQCRSGTENLLYLLSQYPEVEEKVQLVYIYTYGHVIPGFVDKESKNLYGLESTATGSGLIDFGTLGKIKEPIRVTDYRHSTLAHIISGISTDKRIIIDNVEENHEVETMSNEDEKYKLGLHLANGFGKVTVPPGRQKLQERSNIPPSSYRKEFNRYYSDNDSKINSEMPEHISEILRDYNLQFQSILNEFWNRHIDLIESEQKDKESFKDSALQLLNELKVFLDESRAEEVYQSLKLTLEEIEKTPTIKSPDQIHDTILHNLNLTLNKIN